MKSALMAVAITALMGGLVIAPVTQQSAEAQVYGGLKSAGTTGGAIGDNNLILVGRGGGHGAAAAATVMGAAATRRIGTTGVAGATPIKATRTTTPITTTIAPTGTAATIGIIGGTEALTPTVMATAIAPGSAVRP